jgi:CheY-like chemotaxis protein
MFRVKKKKKILLVEDDKLLVTALDEVLTNAKFRVKKVTNGLKVVEKAKKFKPDLILLDLILPGMDGFAVLQKLKSTEDTKNIDVIVLSNLEKPSDIKAAGLLKAKQYIIKSMVSLDDIVFIVKKNTK